MNEPAPPFRGRRFSSKPASAPKYRNPFYARGLHHAPFPLPTVMSARFVTLSLCVGLVLAGCDKQETKATRLPVADVTRGDIAVRVQATGTVETIDPVEIKSKAGGAITQLPVEVGSKVEARAMLAQIDPRDVKNRYDQ